MAIVFINFLTIISFFQSGQLGLKTDLIKDRKLLNQEHVEIDSGGLKIFDKYGAIDLSKFTTTKKKIKNHLITRWKSKSNPQFSLYKIMTIMKGDTTFDAIERDEVTRKPKSQTPTTFKLTPQNYHYNTYIIAPKKNEQLIYMTEKNEGLVAYWVDGKNMKSFTRL